MRDRSQKGVAHPLGSRGGARRENLAGECRTINSGGGLVGERFQQRPCLRIERAEAFCQCNADDSDAAARSPQRHEEPGYARHSRGADPGRLVMRKRQLRGGHAVRIERVLGRPGGAQHKLAVLFEQNRGCAAEHRLDLAGRSLRYVVQARQSRKLASELVEPPRAPHPLLGNPRLVPHPAGQRGGDHGDNEKHEQRQQLIRLGDRECVERLDEEEIVGQEGKHRGVDRRPHPEDHGREQHGH